MFGIDSLYMAIFTIVTVVVYYVSPVRYRIAVLCLTSMVYIYQLSRTGFWLAVAISILVYTGALWSERSGTKSGNAHSGKKLLLLLIAALLSILVIYKYTNFAGKNINILFEHFYGTKPLRIKEIAVPAGLSYYLFTSVSYLGDVCRGKIEAEKNVWNFLTYMLFYPKFTAGPIERPSHFLDQIRKSVRYDCQNLRKGILYIALGLFLKTVIANRLALVIDPVYNDFYSYAGCDIMFATILYAIQLYSDFSGYSYLAIGYAELFGIQLIDNFRCPYFAQSISEFWRKWHISLTSWFTDYLYIPLGGSRKGEARGYLNTLAVFLVSGMWHGAQWSFIAWGGVNGGLVILDKYIRKRGGRFFGSKMIRSDRTCAKVIRILATFLFVDATWLFFRANSFMSALRMGQRILFHFDISRAFSLGILGEMEGQYVFILLFALFIFLAVDLIKEKGKNPIEYVLGRNFLTRWSFYMMLVVLILFYGVYGNDYVQTQFIYFQF